jgi:hypothetical protein
MLVEQNMTGTVLGELPATPGRGRRATLGTLYAYAARDGPMRRAPVRIDRGHPSPRLAAA